MKFSQTQSSHTSWITCHMRKQLEKKKEGGLRPSERRNLLGNSDLESVLHFRGRNSNQRTVRPHYQVHLSQYERCRLSRRFSTSFGFWFCVSRSLREQAIAIIWNSLRSLAVWVASLTLTSTTASAMETSTFSSRLHTRLCLGLSLLFCTWRMHLLGR